MCRTKGLLLVSLLWFLGAAQATPQPLTLSPTEMAKLSHFFPSDESQPVIWDKKPIAIVLPIGKEKLVTFSETVEFGVNHTELPTATLKVQNNNHTLYFTAHIAFPSQRVYVKLVESGKIILLDIAAKPEASTTPITVETLNPVPNATVTSAEKNTVTAHDKTIKSPSKTVSRVALVRYATQQLYAPQRLLRQDPRIFRVAMQAYPVEPLLLDGSALAQPLASWRTSHYFVTAVLVRNQLAHSQTLDPRNLCGSWVAASLFPRNRIAEKGNTRDSTTAFLISHEPFGEALRACRGKEVRRVQ